MSHSDIISVVSNSASIVFIERIDGQEIHDNIRKTKLMQTVKTNMIQSSSQQNLQNGQHWNFRTDCRGLENKIHKFFLFLTKENIDIDCLNKVQKWQKRYIHEKHLIITEANASSFPGSVITARKRIKVKEFRPILSRKKQKRTGIRDNWCKLGNTNQWNFMDNQCLQFTQSRPKFYWNIWQQPPKHVHLWGFQFYSSRAQVYIHPRKRRKTAGNNW